MTKLRLATLLPLLLTGCLPTFEAGAPVLHDVALYTPEGSALYGYFYGEPATLNVGSREVRLTDGTSDDPLSVPGALLVDGQPYLRQEVAPLGNAPVVVQRIPYSTDLSVTAEEALGGVLYFDGELWFTLLEEADEGDGGRVVPRERFEGLYGLGELTRAEAEVFERALEARGPVVVAALADTRERTRQASGLGGYQSTALAVQEGIETVGVTPTPTAAPDWEVLATGTQATGGESPSFELATSRADLERLWSRAYGAMTAAPPPPEVDFGSSSVAAVFLGQKRTGGYSVDVQNVAVEGGEVYLDVVTREPGPGAFTTQALTHPWVMVEVNVPNLGSAWFRDAATGELLGTARSTLGK
jgi:hypothetical protein